MPADSLAQILILLSASVLLVALARRLGLPPILGYLLVGIALGPFSLNLLRAAQTRALAEIGVVLLLFTLGLDVSFPRMWAMRREVFGLGSVQTIVVGAVGALAAHTAHLGWDASAVLGGALAMSSTPLVVRQLEDQAELNRSHGRLSFAVLLFQDLAVVPLLALASLPAAGSAVFTPAAGARLAALGLLTLGAVLLIGRWLLRPLLYLIAHSRLRELFTLAALLIVLTAAWVTQRLGLSMALGAFLAGMMFAETEYRHQIEAVVRPFRELLLGLFFISVGMLLDVRLLAGRFFTVFGLAALLLAAKTLLGALAARAFVASGFKALRTALTLSGGGELGIALLTLLAQRATASPQVPLQLLLAALVLSLVASPLIIRYNKRIARLLLHQVGPPASSLEREQAAARELARREHVVLCGFGRVGQGLARVLVSQGFEYLAVDLDPGVVRRARQAGEPVIWGDCADEELLRTLGLELASVVVVTYAEPRIALATVRAIRRQLEHVPVLVRVPDETRLVELHAAGATEVVPETVEATLTLVSQALRLIGVPAQQAARTIDGLRARRYATLRSPRAAQDAEALSAAGQTWPEAEQLRSVVLPPRAWAVGRRLREVRERAAEVEFTAIRRHGITGREPTDDTELAAGDVVVLYGTTGALERAEALLLGG